MANIVPFYTHSLNDARHYCEVDKWRASHSANISCKEAIENSIAKNYNNDRLANDCAKPIIEEYGFDRVNFILQYNMKRLKGDSRISDKNIAWGKNFYAPQSNVRKDYIINSHPVLLNSFTNQVRNEWAKLGLWDSSHCDDITGQDLESKILVLSPRKLNDKYKTPEDQLFIATGGFGCSPTAIGRSVYGYFAKDNEHCSWDRSSFIGIMKEEFIPNWVKAKFNIEGNTVKPSSKNDVGVGETSNNTENISQSL